MRLPRDHPPHMDWKTRPAGGRVGVSTSILGHTVLHPRPSMDTQVGARKPQRRSSPYPSRSARWSFPGQ